MRFVRNVLFGLAFLSLLLSTVGCGKLFEAIDQDRANKRAQDSQAGNGE